MKIALFLIIHFLTFANTVRGVDDIASFLDRDVVGLISCEDPKSVAECLGEVRFMAIPDFSNGWASLTEGEFAVCNADVAQGLLSDLFAVQTGVSSFHIIIHELAGENISLSFALRFPESSEFDSAESVLSGNSVGLLEDLVREIVISLIEKDKQKSRVEIFTEFQSGWFLLGNSRAQLKQIRDNLKNGNAKKPLSKRRPYRAFRKRMSKRTAGQFSLFFQPQLIKKTRLEDKERSHSQFAGISSAYGALNFRLENQSLTIDVSGRCQARLPVQGICKNWMTYGDIGELPPVPFTPNRIDAQGVDFLSFNSDEAQDESLAIHADSARLESSIFFGYLNEFGRSSGLHLEKIANEEAMYNYMDSLVARHNRINPSYKYSKLENIEFDLWGMDLETMNRRREDDYHRERKRISRLKKKGLLSNKEMKVRKPKKIASITDPAIRGLGIIGEWFAQGSVDTLIRFGEGTSSDNPGELITLSESLQKDYIGPVTFLRAYGRRYFIGDVDALVVVKMLGRMTSTPSIALRKEYWNSGLVPASKNSLQSKTAAMLYWIRGACRSVDRVGLVAGNVADSDGLFFFRGRAILKVPEE